MSGKLFKDRVNGKGINAVMLCSVGAMCAGFLMNSLSVSATGEVQQASAEETRQVVIPETIYASFRQEPKERADGTKIFVDGEYYCTISADDAPLFDSYVAGKLNDAVMSHSAVQAVYNCSIESVDGRYLESDFITLDEAVYGLFESEDKLASITVSYVEETSEAIPFETVEQSSPLLPKGQSHIEQDGVDGKRDTVALVTEIDGVRVSQKTLKDEITKPTDKIVLNGTASFSKLMWPVGGSGGYVSSGFGYRDFDDSFHKGIDIAGVPQGTDIYAVYAGTVIRSETNRNGYGEFVVVDHGNGYHTAYAHMSFRNVQVGDTVLAGDSIGGIGTTGQSTGVHLHFEVRCGGDFANPFDFLA